MSPFKYIKARFSNRPDSEHQQAFVRILIGIVMTIAMLPDAISAGNYPFIIGNIAYLIAVLGVPAWMLFNPGMSPTRRIYGIVLDVTAIGAAMILGEEHATAIYVLYIWITTGNGFRFGQKYLLIALALGVISLCVVSQYSEQFINNNSLIYELIGVYVLFTAYVNSLVKRLYEAIDVAQSASKAKQTFLSTMSHELRTPLHAIVGLMALLKAESLKRKKSLDLVGSVETAVEHMLAIVNDILDFSKIEAGKVEISRASVDVDALNISMAKMFMGQAQQKNLKFNTYFSPQLPTSIVSDETRLRQILSNILSNALKFTGEGEIVLLVELVADKMGSPNIKWSVKDTGIGISKETIDKIFESFTQADASTSRKYGGTGLGTTIARELVLLLGGDIGIESTVGKGTTFWFTIPAVGSTDENPQGSLRFNAPVLALVPESRSDVIEACRTHHGIAHTRIEVIDAEISRENIGAIGLIVLPVDGKLPPLAHYAIVKGLKLVVLDEAFTEVRKREFIRLGAHSICRQVSEVPRALRMLQINAGSLNDAPQSATTPVITGKRILIADDNKTNLLILTAILHMHSHIVTQAMNGDDALDMALDDDFDLFIFDMNMPDTNGLELTKILRSMGLHNSARPIVILTADATLEAEKAVLEAGANLFITKPISPDSLLDRITSLFLQEPVTSSQLPDNVEKVPLVFNKAALDELLNVCGVPDFFETLVAGYLEDSKANYECLISAYGERDYEKWRTALHAMKGSAINLRLECLAHAVDLAHDLTPQNFHAKMESALAHITHEMQRAEAALLAAPAVYLTTN
jgi:two-component system sensor histidine kinase RpfC